MKKVYVVVTHTGTVLSRIIKMYTRDEYSHVSISLDKNLDRMYSFGRVNPYNPVLGGFVHEGINFGTFKRFKKTVAKVLEIDVTDEQYKIAEETIENMRDNKDDYKFNVIGLFAVSLHKQIKRDNYFYCAEFVKHVLEESNINNDLPELIKPEDFKEIKNSKEIYHGLLNTYSFGNYAKM